MLIVYLMTLTDTLRRNTDLRSFEAVYLFCMLGIVLTVAFSRFSDI
jgi:multisubunit Na+/H+ antiporter MnhF subunit